MAATHAGPVWAGTAKVLITPKRNKRLGRQTDGQTPERCFTLSAMDAVISFNVAPRHGSSTPPVYYYSSLPGLR